MVDLAGLVSGNGAWVTTAVWQHGGDNGCGNEVNCLICLDWLMGTVIGCRLALYSAASTVYSYKKGLALGVSTSVVAIAWTVAKNQCQSPLSKKGVVVSSWSSWGRCALGPGGSTLVWLSVVPVGVSGRRGRLVCSSRSVHNRSVPTGGFP